MEKKSVFGLDENLAAALSYILGPFSGIFVLIMERENKFVRFHALQATLWFTMLWIAGWVLSMISGLPIIGFLLGIVISPVLYVGVILSFISKVLLVLQAFNGKTFKIPIIGDVALAQVNK